jgi:hypothetical protein
VAIVNGQVIGGAKPAQAADVARAGSTTPRPDLTVTWTKVRGPGAVTVTPPRVALSTNADRNVIVEANATATFSAPGEYVLRAQPIEAAGAGDGLCCFTFANIKVIVN